MAEPAIRILGLDPSSTALGAAVLDVGRAGWELYTFGVSRVRGRRPAELRCLALASVAQRLCRLHLPEVVVVEIPSGKVARGLGRRGGTGAGLSVYGMAVGATLQAVAAAAERKRVWPVSELEWTGQIPKGDRLRLTCAQWAAYREFSVGGRDAGGDAGDAIGLACWAAATIDRPGVTGWPHLDCPVGCLHAYNVPQDELAVALDSAKTSTDQPATPPG